MEDDFFYKPRIKVLVSNDFREMLIRQDTSLIEQRLISCILSSLKDVQSELINVKMPDKDLLQIQTSNIDYLKKITDKGIVNFHFSLREINPEKKMKNQTIKHALVNMSNLNWLQVRDDKINGFKAVPFILEPRWNCSNIYFKMDIEVLKHLVNMSQYYSLFRVLPYEISSSNTIKFLLWMLKFKKRGMVIRHYKQLITELYIPKNKYVARSHFERDFLTSVKADLETFNDCFFEFIYNNGIYTFFIKKNPNFKIEKENSDMLNDIRIKRSIKYLAKSRKLSPSNIKSLTTIYNLKGYFLLSKIIKCKIEAFYKGDEYIDAVLFHVSQYRSTLSQK